MLILTRKQGEAVKIGDDIRIVVMQVRGKQVRLGVEAAQDTRVYREEVYLRIKRENELAGGASVAALDEAQFRFLAQGYEPNAEKEDCSSGFEIRRNA